MYYMYMHTYILIYVGIYAIGLSIHCDILIKFWFLKLIIDLEAEKAMASHSSTLAWKIPWMEEPGRLQSMGSRRVRHDWATSLHFSLSCIGEGNGNPLHCSCLENPRDGGAWWAAVYAFDNTESFFQPTSGHSLLFCVCLPAFLPMKGWAEEENLTLFIRIDLNLSFTTC